MEFTSDASALGADVGIEFIVDRFSQIRPDGGTHAFLSVCWTRDHERLQAFTSVFGWSELQFMQLLWWAVMGASSAVAGLLNRSCILCKVVQSLTWRDVFGRQMSGQVGSSRYRSGQSGRYFFWQLLSLRFCIGFSVSGVDSWFWQPLQDRRPRLSQTPGPSRSAGAWWVECRVRMLWVG